MTVPTPTRRGRTDARRGRLPRASVLVPSAAVVSCQHADGTLLLDVAAGKRITLDQFGGRVWAALADQPTLAALLARLHVDGSSVQRLAEDATQLLARC